MTDSYLFQSGKDGYERLSLLNDICNPYTIKLFNQISCFAGKKILDLGCGTGEITLELAKRAGKNGEVLAIDISEEQLNIARNLALSEGISNISFLQISADEATELKQQFDIINIRFLLMHIENPSNVLQKICQKLSDNGILISEEATAYSSAFCEPASDVFLEWTNFCQMHETSQKSELFFGKETPNLVKKIGLELISCELVQPIFKSKNHLNYMWLAVKELAPAFIKLGLDTEENLIKLSENLKRFANEDLDRLIAFAQHIQVIARKK